MSEWCVWSMMWMLHIGLFLVLSMSIGIVMSWVMFIGFEVCRNLVWVVKFVRLCVCWWSLVRFCDVMYVL